MNTSKKCAMRLTCSALTLCLLLAVSISLGCSAKKPVQTSPVASVPNRSNTTPVAAPGNAGPTQTASDTNPVNDAPCGNGMPRNKAGNCPDIPPCQKRCNIGSGDGDPKGCGYQSDPAGGKFTMYSTQTVNGGKCQWTFPPEVPKP